MTFMLNSNMNIAIVCMVRSDTENNVINKTVYYNSNISKYNLSYVEDVRSLTMIDGNQTADGSCGETRNTLQHSTEVIFLFISSVSSSKRLFKAA